MINSEAFYNLISLGHLVFCVFMFFAFYFCKPFNGKNWLLSASVCWFIVAVGTSINPREGTATFNFISTLYTVSCLFLLPMFLISLWHNNNQNFNADSISLSFKGRMPRSIYWVISFLTIGILFEQLILIEQVQMNVVTSHLSLSEAIFDSIAILLLFLFNIWVILSINVQRWHDLNNSGWYALIQFIPFVGLLISFVLLGCIRGTQGPNNFGDDPLKLINDNNDNNDIA